MKRATAGLLSGEATEQGRATGLGWDRRRGEAWNDGQLGGMAGWGHWAVLWHRRAGRCGGITGWCRRKWHRTAGLGADRRNGVAGGERQSGVTIDREARPDGDYGELSWQRRWDRRSMRAGGSAPKAGWLCRRTIRRGSDALVKTALRVADDCLKVFGGQRRFRNRSNEYAFSRHNSHGM